nr:MAG TPA: zinc finger domain-containing protein [Caudoviricetes sp.]
MNNPKCRYCGQPMKIDEVYYDTRFYKCNCEGYQKEVELMKEIDNLEYQRRKKIVELRKHRDTGIYSKERNSLKNAISKLDYEYEKEPEVK